MWWEALGALRQAMFIIGCCAGGVLLIQIIMTLIGLGGDADFDGPDVDADTDVFNTGGANIFGMKLLSFRSIVAFLGIGSWTAFILLDDAVIGWPVWAAILAAVAAGVAAALLMAYAMFAIEKMQSSGNISIENAVGKTGDVYLRIPPGRAHAGKIQITVQERLREYEAVTDAGRQLERNEKVKVVGVIDEGTLLVEPF